MTSPFAPRAPLQTAVLFLVFNRPDTTAQVFEAIRQAKPPRLYVAADGPRVAREGETERVAKVREISTVVDWPCEVRSLFRTRNLGCKCAVSSAITWFFEQETQGIILEDDCLPHPDFFPFCENLLDRYSKDEKVSVITGNNFQEGEQRGDASYYFSKYNHCWGWASWRRAWNHYQGSLPFWPKWSASDSWQQHALDKVERRYWEEIFNRVRAGQIDSWAYPWTASVWYHGGLTATPNVNLVSNIGFGPDSTHTTNPNDPDANKKTTPLGEIIHPSDVKQEKQADLFTFNQHYGGRGQRFPLNVLRFPLRITRFAYRRLNGLFK